MLYYAKINNTITSIEAPNASIAQKELERHYDTIGVEVTTDIQTLMKIDDPRVYQE
jgi:hypothetical protein